jgi:uncharacterized protein YndB with AHSA1/START domain
MDKHVKPSLILKRRINAPPPKVFAAWTDPQKLGRWMGPDDMIVSGVADTDPRAGGRYRITMTARNGDTHEVSGVYHEIVPDAKLVFSWAWRSTPERESLVTVTLVPDGAGTVLTLTHEQFFDEDARNHHEHGWTGSLDKLERLLA